MKECNQCGKCCINYSDGGLTASAEEIALWEVFRPDIARYVSAGTIWTDPESGEQLKRCPWLRHDPAQNNYLCDIYDDRPADCQYYPVTIEQMLRDECEMLEKADLRPHKNAQRILDRIMANSRPALDSGDE